MMLDSQQMLVKVGTLVTMDGSRRILRHGAILLKGPTIEAVLSAEELGQLPSFEGRVVDEPTLTATPGFIQTHLHLCQTLFRGLADDLDLLDWLTLKIYPLEAAHNAASMHASAMLGVAELLRCGTTTIMDMGSIHHEAAIVEVLQETGVRAFIGKAMMDINDAYPALRESTADAVRTTLAQAEQWHGSSEGRIRYAVAPRFLLSCTDALLQEAYRMTSSFPGMLFHTHAAENRREQDAVRRRCGTDTIEFFDALGVLGPATCLAHCIHLSPHEMDVLQSRGARVLHCPSSNLKLGSGVAPIPELLSRGITVSLGADGAPCNNTLNVFEEMRLAALLQKPLHGPAAMPASQVLEFATLGGARALGMNHEIGSLEAGKRADMVLLDLRRLWNPAAETDPSSVIVYSGSPENVRSVMIDGRWVYRDGQHVVLDEHRTLERAREELRLLLQRVE